VKLIAYGCSTTVDSTLRISQIQIDPDFVCNINLPNQDSTYLSSCTGNLFDSGGGLNYLDNNQGIVVIEPTGGSGVQLTFQSFNYAAGDFVAIYDGASTQSPLIGYYNGANPPGVITSSGTALTLVESTNGFNNREGFAATWSCAVSNDRSLGERSFSVWPNPSTGLVNLQYRANGLDDLRIKVLNTAGQTVREFDYNNQDLIEITMDLNDLGKGLYFIEIRGTDFSKTSKVSLQ